MNVKVKLKLRVNYNSHSYVTTNKVLCDAFVTNFANVTIIEFNFIQKLSYVKKIKETKMQVLPLKENYCLKISVTNVLGEIQINTFSI